MSSYINGVIPARFSTFNDLWERKALLEFKLERAEAKSNDHLNAYRNVFLAIKEWGYIYLKDEETGETIRIVEEPTKESKNDKE